MVVCLGRGIHGVCRYAVSPEMGAYDVGFAMFRVFPKKHKVHAPIFITERKKMM